MQDINLLSTNKKLSVIAMPDNRMVILGENDAVVVFSTELAKDLAREINSLSLLWRNQETAIASSIPLKK